jgi:hypothetical protein
MASTVLTADPKAASTYHGGFVGDPVEYGRLNGHDLSLWRRRTEFNPCQGTLFLGESVPVWFGTPLTDVLPEGTTPVGIAGEQCFRSFWPTLDLQGSLLSGFNTKWHFEGLPVASVALRSWLQGETDNTLKTWTCSKYQQYTTLVISNNWRDRYFLRWINQ